MAAESHHLAVCVDCAMLIANGEGTEAQAEEIAKRWSEYTIAIDTGEPWFSWQDCGGCGSPLGGDRFEAIAFPL